MNYENRVKEHFWAVGDSLHPNIFAIGLYGSQNYKLDTVNSDVDTKMMIIPSFKDIVLSKTPISLIHTMENNEHCDIKDIRLMFQNFKKQNINFLEILFGFTINPIFYNNEFKMLIDNREMIARYNNYAFINAVAGMAMEKYKALCHPYPTIKWKIDKWGYDGKQLHHIVRLACFLDMWLKGAPFEECLVNSHQSQGQTQFLLDCKNNVLSLERALEDAKYYSGELQQMKKDYMDNTSFQINKDVDALLEEVLVKVFTKSFKEELNSGE